MSEGRYMHLNVKTAPPAQRQESWMQMLSGGPFDLLAPTPEQVRLADIVHALAGTNRFNGHSERYMTVAEHSVNVEALFSEIVPGATPEQRLMALLHDAHEAYLGDVVQPLKQALATLVPQFSPAWDMLTRRVDVAIYKALGLPEGLTAATAAAIKLADLRALDLERRCIMAPSQREWGTLCEPFETDVRPLGVLPSAAAKMFISRYLALIYERHGVDYRLPAGSGSAPYDAATGICNENGTVATCQV